MPTRAFGKRTFAFLIVVVPVVLLVKLPVAPFVVAKNEVAFNTPALIVLDNVGMVNEMPLYAPVAAVFWMRAPPVMLNPVLVAVLMFES